MNTEYFDLLATLLAYPNDTTRAWLDRWRLSNKDSAAVDFLDRFAATTAALTTEELQELYTQTFDLNPTCSLEVGWQLYGENYARGEFLVAMRQTLRRLGVAETTELPDHLTHVLPALGRMDAMEAGRFSVEFLLPALEKMLQGLTGKGAPYANVLEAIRATISIPSSDVIGHASLRRELPMVTTALSTEREVCHG